MKTEREQEAMDYMRRRIASERNMPDARPFEHLPPHIRAQIIGDQEH